MNQIQMAARMYDARDTLRRVFGDGYPKRVEGYKDFLRRCSERWKTDTVPTMIRVLKESSDPDGWTTTWFLAACVEIVEPEE